VKIIKTKFSIWYGYRASIPEYKKCLAVVTAGGEVTRYCGLCDVECAFLDSYTFNLKNAIARILQCHEDAGPC
jgi:hypothetical protein